jgi:sugar lactone lactonase YvrE
LLLYEQAQSIATGFKEPRGICIDLDGKLLVVGDQAVGVFEADGKFLRRIDLGAQPRCISQAANGKIYIGLTDCVLVMDAALNKVAAWDKLSDKSVISSIAPGGKDVFVADAGRRVVLRFDTSGKLLDTIGQRASGGAPIFVVPSPYFDVAIAPDGLLRVADTGRYQVETYTFDGKLTSAWGRFGTDIEGFTGCCNPVNFAILSDGGFVTAEKGLTRVKIYDPTGKFVGVVAGPDSFLHHDTICAANGGNCQAGGLDVAVDRQDRIFVMDPYTAEVRIFVRKSAATNPAKDKP